jgi:hypothetical protein
MKDITPQQLQQYLTQLPPAQLVDDIIDLYRKFDEIKDYYHNRILPSEGQLLLEKYKAIIQHEFFPARGFGRAKLSEARKAITAYRKISGSVVDLADLMIFYVETGVRFTNTYDDINEAFYNSMERMNDRAAEFVVKHNLKNQFDSRLERIVAETSGIGWGFHDGLTEIYAEYFGDGK